MTTVTVEEAQAKLPELIDLAAAGEQVVITRDDRPIAELVLRPRRPKSGFGCCKGMVAYVSDDFDAPLEDFKDYME